jgi:asparagine synthase (glutamine-hydrolysing)
MCGILGISKTNKESEVLEAISTFKYRGPDHTGIKSLGSVTLGNVRLAIIDDNPRSNQPMQDGREEISIVFNGEIYNYKELRKLLTEYELKTEGDTETVVSMTQRKTK